MMAREVMEYDVAIIGAGPSGLSAAIRLGQLATQHQYPLRICVLEKGAEVGAHSLSGAVFEPRALTELIPDWQAKNAPLNTKAKHDHFWFLSKNHKIPLPTPPQMHNQNNYIISLGALCKWLALEAEKLKVDIFPGFAASEARFNAEGRMTGVLCGDLGINKAGKPKAHYQSGVEIHARYTLLAEGCRGSLTKKLMKHFSLSQHCDPQTYGLGIKELWEVAPEKHQSGNIIHTIGFPLDRKTYGGSFLYHFDKNLVSIGFVVGLDYQNPTLDPYEEFQRFKLHPSIRPLLEGARRIGYGARALSEGGLQSMPRLFFPGGLLIGDAAGFLNVPKLKGNHTAMKSGMIAAEAVFSAFKNKDLKPTLDIYETMIRDSWIGKELYLARNIRPAFRLGLLAGLSYAALDTYLLRGKAPWTFHNHADNLSLKRINEVQPLHYAKHDNIITFDKLTSVQLANTAHEEDQPVHIKLKDKTVPIKINLALYGSPEQYYCPAAVFEILKEADNQKPYLQINASNCIHCKTCDIKDPTQNIDWVPPEGGGGPHYENM